MSLDPLAWLNDVAESRTAAGLTRALKAHGPVAPGQFLHDGREFINFGSNDYLGIASDPRLAEAARAAAEVYGWGAGASPLVSGWTEIHQRLADALAEFEHTEAALIFPTGFAANLGTVAALVGPGDAVYADRLNHACLIDGARLSGASLRVYPHNDSDRLASILSRDRGRFRRTLIATDGVFSMDGDVAPLAELVEVAERFGAMLLVDEAHGTGVFGPDGRGASASCGVADRVHVRVGTLSKALGSLGGFVAGSRRLIEHLVNHARPLIYSTALPPPAAAAALAALEIARTESWRRERVNALGARLRAAVNGAGLHVLPSTGPIVAVVLGEPEAALACAGRLHGLGLFVPAIRPPTVPAGTARLRVTLSAAHTDADLGALIAALSSGPGLDS